MSAHRVGKIASKDKFVPPESHLPFEPYKSLEADRLKLVGDGPWNLARHLEDDLWLPYPEPLVLRRGQITKDANLPNFFI